MVQIDCTSKEEQSNGIWFSRRMDDLSNRVALPAGFLRNNSSISVA